MFKTDLKQGLEVTVKNVTKDKEYTGKVANVGDKAFTMRTLKGHLISCSFADELLVNGTALTDKPAGKRGRKTQVEGDFYILNNDVNPAFDLEGDDRRFVLIGKDEHGFEAAIGRFHSYSGAWQRRERILKKNAKAAATAETSVDTVREWVEA